MSDQEALREYAGLFGPDTLLDLDGSFKVSGVPHFIVSKPDGKVIRDVSGVPLGASSIEEFASYYDLP
jgi:hypothetical protein